MVGTITVHKTQDHAAGAVPGLAVDYVFFTLLKILKATSIGLVYVLSVDVSS